MAAKKKINGNGNGEHTVIPSDFQEVGIIEGYDLSAKHAVWNPQDKVALKGLLMGIVNLPSAQANQEHWTCYAVKLTGPTVVRDADSGDPRVADAGELVVLTATASLQRLGDAARDPVRVFEVYLKFGGKERTKSGNTVNVFEHMIVGKSFARTNETRLPTAPAMKALPPSSEGSEEALPF